MARYACPIDGDVVLFADDEGESGTGGKRLSLFPLLSQVPKECPKCRKYYYRTECVILQGGTDHDARAEG